MVPPQERPTFQAVSSATPDSSVLGLPLSMPSSASVTTAPSTQPPDTEPRKLPSWSMTRFEPTGRGADPQVSTTVASATPRPALRQSSAALRMSSSRARVSMMLSSYKSRHLLQPLLRIARTSPARRQRTGELRDRIEIMDRPEFVDMRQDGADAARLGLEALEAQQRIEPDEAPRRAMQAVDLEFEPVVGIALQPIGNQEHDRALREHAARPALVEFGERGRDARAAGPV